MEASTVLLGRLGPGIILREPMEVSPIPPGSTLRGPLGQALPPWPKHQEVRGRMKANIIVRDHMEENTVLLGHT